MCPRHYAHVLPVRNPLIKHPVPCIMACISLVTSIHPCMHITHICRQLVLGINLLHEPIHVFSKKETTHTVIHPIHLNPQLCIQGNGIFLALSCVDSASFTRGDTPPEAEGVVGRQGQGRGGGHPQTQQVTPTLGLLSSWCQQNKSSRR
jgi:hypothetical protein